ncbi:minor extracellular serine protease Vpr [Amphibacillus marinus]|uniref:Minor extracellular serine protease Vpr n=1 Tax=Amphibacillus marinus TaxID=872970 RepID=A0A1H8N1H5_9BACI|nr:S8 family serine peptidase [Amphibacillus marinus]SEO23430.1 minor extracellular serine protease Vpr [Amphibacillus marinus]
MRKLLMITLLFLILFPAKTNATLEKSKILIELNTHVANFEQDLERHFPHVKVIERFTTLLNAIVVEGTGYQLNRILSDKAVKGAYPITTYQVNPIYSDEEIPTHEVSQINQLQHTGKGVKIGVIDTGIDYTHPDLAANYFGGYDVIDFDGDPMETLPEQGMPTLHGTHVAGIIAANGEHKGIAPDAELYSYRALGPGGMGTTIQVIAALEKAVDDGMDIINLSLGNSINGPDWPTSIAVNRAIDKGISVVIANGNTGPAPWTVGSPATATKAISVGASTQTYTQATIVEPIQNRTLAYTAIQGTPAWRLTKDYPVIYGGIGSDTLPNASGKIVLFKRGELTFSEKVEQAQLAEAEAVIIYNDSNEQIQAGVEFEAEIPAILISEADGEWLISQANKEGSVWLDTMYQTHENEVASFSSRGPVTASWQIKPEIVAPGVNITSTVPDGYASLQGTSMAAPYIAGALAVLKEAQPDWTPYQLKAALLTQAKPLAGQLPTEQGMGEVDLLAAINTPVIIENSLLNLGLISQFKEIKTHKLEVTNTSNDPLLIQFDRPNLAQGIKWELPATITIQPNQTETIPLTITIRSEQLAEGMHQGYLSVQINKQTYQLPYLFINQTAAFPKLAGFELDPVLNEIGSYTLKLQLAEENDKIMLDLYDPVTYDYLGTILNEDEVAAGLYEERIDLTNIEVKPAYLINIILIKEDRIDHIQQLFTP